MAFTDKNAEKAYQKKYRAENKARISALNHALYLRKKSQIKQYQTKYYAEHKAEVLMKNEARRQQRKAQYAESRARGQRSYYIRNRAKVLARTKAYAQAHPEVGIAHQGKRRAQQLRTQSDPAGIRNWMKAIRSLPFVRCHWCGTKVSGKAIHFDHVIALGAGGTHEIGNLCAACPDCNLSKQDKSPSEWSVNQQVFLHL